jgi:serine protease Do
MEETQGTTRRPWFVVMVAAATLLLGASAFGAGVAVSQGSAASTTSVSSAAPSATTDTGAPISATMSDPVVGAIAKVTPAVVNITSRVPQTNPLFGGTTFETGTGTGFIVRSDGVIVTNDHVVEGASSISVTLADGHSYDATVLHADSAHDLAVVKIDATGLPTVQLGNSSGVLLGQRVVAIGFALDLGGGPSVTSGIVSSLDRTIQVQDPNAGTTGSRTYRDVLQTDAAINPGNSGGPLINLNGQVVGIDSAGTQQAQNIGFAIPINEAQPIIARSV